MRCPTDGVELVMSERQGIEIDYCPSCRGIWLDRGELDKILERAAGVPDPGMPGAPSGPDPRYVPDPAAGTGPGYTPGPGPAPDPRYAPDPRLGHGTGYREPAHRDDRGYRDGPGYRDDRGYRDDPRQGYGRRRKRRESWLEDLFDFD